MRESRRRVLGAGSVLAGSLFLPQPWAWVWAQSNQEGTLKLLKAPKVALVVGNSKYKDAPELKNPANDAKGVGDALRAAGFEVNTLLDTGREQLIDAIRNYVRAMEQKKAVGLFYFAGHGVQLAWRNYMLPIDAVIDKIDDVGKQSVDIARLMEGLTKAGNPMNVIILDACRENPFGKDFRVEHKGLSQMDAPTHTILAYATSPGNVASDGDGANGLYTENLLREMRVPEAKIEDVFKRVRLGVRRKTNGAQIPWESTSLEDDFWFLPPKSVGAASEAERTKAFDDELALWSRIAELKDAPPFEDYLRRFPSGKFSELAQLRLERALAAAGEKRVEITAQAGNPYTQGSARATLGHRVGDAYVYREFDLETRLERATFNDDVIAVNDNEVRFGNGLIVDLLGNLVMVPDGTRYTPRQDEPLEYAIGRRWSTRFRFTNEKAGRSGSNEAIYHISRKERVAVAGESFECFVIEGHIVGANDRGQRVETRTRKWKSPERMRRPLIVEARTVMMIERGPRLGPLEKVLRSERRELVSYKLV